MSTGPIKGESVDTRRYSPTRRISGELRLARQGLNWLLHKWGEPAISLPVLYQLDPGPIGETGTARKVCENPRRPRLARTHRRGRHGCWRPTPRGLADRTGMTMAAFRRFDPYAVLGEDKHLDREGLAGLAATRLETQNRPHMLTTPDFAPAKENQDRGVTPAKVAKSAKTTLTWGDVEAKPAEIIEHGGNIPRLWVEGLAWLDPDRPPGDVPTKRWLTFIDDIGQFLDSPFCTVAAALGWGPHDLFGCERDRPFARIDQCGLLWLLNGDKLVALTGSSGHMRPYPVPLGTYASVSDAGGAGVWIAAPPRQKPAPQLMRH